MTYGNNIKITWIWATQKKTNNNDHDADTDDDSGDNDGDVQPEKYVVEHVAKLCYGYYCFDFATPATQSPSDVIASA